MRRLRLLLWIGLAAAGTALPARIVWAHDQSDGGAARGDINGLFTIIFWIAVPVFILVEGLILFAIVRYRRQHASEAPEQVEGNRTLELTWTILSFVIVAVLFTLTYRFMTTKYKAKAISSEQTPDLTVHVTGYMFNWDYSYFLGEDQETGVTTTRTLTVPAHSLILLEITSRDVQHSFWVPKLAGKVDAIPGQTNTMWLDIGDPGVYTGNCAEYCGLDHYAMVIEVDAIDSNTFFNQWLPDQMAAAAEFHPMGTDMESEMPEGDADNGERLFTQLGCAGCHGAQAGVGPALSEIRRDMNEHAGYTAEQYLRESILMPCAYQVEGYNCNIMPNDFGDKLDMSMLADLIEYLKEDQN
jgi:cytochrome c oxidase subunit 2